ncbi:RNA chaperone Hfq [Saccharibacillus sp. JS10]|uniref:RNA chaperone Hfq n=1 Tax=Saccharibacillus sp. JS10 TaxID=2950552 RepID=UPI00210B3C25|nr:RNA chaperone Hfq [Saccharibacillus sp. JS10]MCQ4085359.1 RNA chaperone Hfq [Saccharibacillus sp. JS10]
MTNGQAGEHKSGSQQDDRLKQLCDAKIDCTVITVNGARIQGKIEAFDRFVIVVLTPTGKQSLIYKHAVSTIVEGMGK